jgi:WD40 repeat protein/serine/threonine protein kinase
VTPTGANCQNCGTALAANAIDGLCPKCLLTSALRAGFSTSLELKPCKNPEQQGKHELWGDYELIEEIARGGMGKVFKARQVSLKRIVAVKVLLYGEFTHDKFVKRFWSEAEAAASLQHPNIVIIHEIGTHKGQPYFSMDYISGKSLSDVIKEKALAPKRAAAYLKIIAEAIQHAHERGILHRDLKPSNILIDSAEQPRITDFGLARNMNGSAGTDSDSLIGSPNYMPPEQAMGETEALPAGDIYSLGAILYHMITGRPPVLAATLQETILELLHNEPVAPRLLNPSVPRDLETICLTCLNKDPLRRYSSAKSLASDLECFLSNRPIQARPSSAAVKMTRWCQRKPVAAAFLVTLFLAAAGAIAASFHFNQLRRESQYNLYLGDMNQAHHDWQEGNYGMALSYLRKNSPLETGRDLRGFEWQHLWWLTRGNCAFKLPQHKQVVGTLNYSPDGELLATFTWDTSNRLKVWEMATQKMRYALPDISSFGGFSRDGEVIVGGKRDGTVLFCEAKSGKVLRAIATGGEIVAFAAEKKIVATIQTNGTLQVWSAEIEKPVFSLPHVSRRFFDYGQGSPIALSADGTMLAVVEHADLAEPQDRGITIWDLVSNRERAFLREESEIRTLQFSSRGDVLAVGDGAGETRIWNIATEKALAIHGHSLPVVSLAFSPDGSMIATGSTDETIKLWNALTGELIDKKITGHVGACWSLAFAPDGETLASGTRDGPIRFWNLSSLSTPETITNLLSDRYGNFAFSPDGKLMAGGCRDKFVRVWEVATMREIASLAGQSYVMMFTSDNQELLTAREGGAAQWWNFKTHQARRIPSYGGIGTVTAVAVSQDRKMVGVGHDSGSIQVLEVDSGKVVGSYVGHLDTILSIAFTSDGTKFATGSRDKTLRVWELKTASNLVTCAEHKGAVSGLAIAPNGKWMASGCSANTIKFWDMTDLRKSVDAISWHHSAIRSLSIHPNGRILASGSEDRTVKLWDHESRRQLGSFQFESPVRLTVFAPDGNTLAVITDRGTLHLLRTVPLLEADQDLAKYYN